MDFSAEALDITPEGDFLAVGCSNGHVMIYDCSIKSSDKLTLLHHIKDRTEKITVVKFCPNNKLLAVGGMDTKIIVYNITNKFRRQCTLRYHQYPITALDFSKDGNIIQSTCEGYSINYLGDLTKGTRNRNGAANYKEEPWYSWTCSIGWPVQGIWPACSNG